MNQIKHSKYKNTGIIFELLVRQVTNDVLTSGDSPAVKILKKYFSSTELAKEQRLYNLVNTQERLTETKAEAVLQTIAETALKFDLAKLNKEKYNLIKEIKKHYDVNNFFKNKISNYKTSAAVFTLLESYRSVNFTDPKQVVNNKITLLEHLTQKEIINDENKEIKEFLQESKDIRILTYRMLIEKFNEKYSNFTGQQTNIYNRLSGLAQLGLSGTTGSANAQIGTATNVANLGIGAANAVAAGQQRVHGEQHRDDRRAERVDERGREHVQSRCAGSAAGRRCRNDEPERYG